MTHESLYPNMNPHNKYHRELLEAVVRLLTKQLRQNWQSKAMRSLDVKALEKAKKWLALPVPP